MAIPVPVANDKLDGGVKFAGIQLIFIYLLMTSSLQSNCSQGSFVLGGGRLRGHLFVNRGLLRGHLPQGLICQLRYESFWDTPQNVGNLAFHGKTSKIEQDSTK
jgi:hypothetical protein